MTELPQPKLIIFDCDGVLVDSEGLSADVFSQALSACDVALSADQCMAQFRGLTLEDCKQKLFLERGVRLPDGFINELQRATRTAFARQLQPIPGIERVIQELRLRQLEVCVASNGALEKVRHSLTVTNLWWCFEGCAFSAEQVNNGKPAPDLFLFAAHSMGVEPVDCWVVEDSITGIQAAQAAGMGTFHLPGPGRECSTMPGVRNLDCIEELLNFIEDT